MPTTGVRYIIASGACSAFLFLLIYGFGLGIFLMLLPAIPLLLLGLSEGPKPLLFASILGGMLAGVLTGFGALIFYLGFIALPCLLFSQVTLANTQAVIERKKDTIVEDMQPYRPVGQVLGDISFYLSLAFAAVILHFSGDQGLQPQIMEQMQQGFAHLEPEMQEAAKTMASSWAFLIIGASGWWWMFLLYLHALLTNWLLKKNERHIRPSLSLDTFTLPTWYLGAFIISCLLANAGDATLAFVMKSSAIILMFPYFLLGMREIRRYTSALPGGNITLFFVYFLIFTVLWLVLLIAALGVVRHCRDIKTGLSSA